MDGALAADARALGCYDAKVSVEFRFEPNGVNPEAALIYRWEIFGPDSARLVCYVGKSKNGARRPLRDYKRNVLRLLAGQPYRKSKPDEFRAIHRLMANAVQQQQTLVLTLLKNIAPHEDINAEEQRLRREHGGM